MNSGKLKVNISDEIQDREIQIRRIKKIDMSELNPERGMHEHTRIYCHKFIGQSQRLKYKPDIFVKLSFFKGWAKMKR